MFGYRFICFLGILFFSFLVSPVFAQDGNSFITNYQLSEADIDNQNWAIEQDNDRVMLFANRRGVLSYDGVEWQLIKTPTFPFSIVKDTASGVVYVGCSDNFGYLRKDDRGVYSYVSISGKYNEFGEINQIIINNQHIYFYSEENLFRITKNNYSEIKQFQCKASFPYSGIIKIKNQVYLNITKTGLHKLDPSGPTLFTEGKILANAQILMGVPFDENQVLIGTNENKFFLFDGKTFKSYSIESESYLKESIFSGGINLSENEFALATLTGGCIIADKKSGKTKYIINYQNGLPDDEIFAMGKDNYGGLWVSHEYGISRIDNILPVKNFSSYPGLEGNLTSMIDFNNTIYVSSSRGVFYLSEVKDYKEIEILMKTKKEKGKPESDRNGTSRQNIKSTDDVQKDNGSKVQSKRELRKQKRSERIKNGTNKEGLVVETETKTEEPEEKKGFIKRLTKSRKKVSNKEEPVVETETKIEEPEEKKNFIQRLTKSKPEEKAQTIKIQALQSVKYVFKKVAGLDEKCRQLISYNNRLLVATNTGLYEVKNNVVKPLIKDRYINYIYQFRDPKRFYIATTTGVFSVFFNAASGGWNIENDYKDFNENVYSVIEDEKGILWFGCENKVYRVILDKASHPKEIKSYNFNNDYSERVLARNILGKPFFFLSSGFFSYEDKKDSVLYNPALNSSFPPNSKYIFSQENFTWIFTGSEWLNINRTTGNATPDDIYLELFDNIHNIYVDAGKNLWVIDGNNSLYKIKAGQKLPTNNFNINIKQITNDTGYVISISKVELDYKNSSLEFHLAAPYYVKKGSTQYQYFVEGLMSGWSKWNTSSNIQLPFIPTGKYKLRVRAKNVLGEISEERTFTFSVAPPFWKTWWFYTFCFIALVSLVFLMIRMRERNLKRSNKILEDKVKLRTSQLQEQTEKTEELLLNILPAETAEELKSKGKATARHYDLVSVLFTDFKGFTKIAEAIKPEELINELDICFIKFDEIIAAYNIEKIKTIGDAYMCAGGLPIRNKGNPILITLAGLEICRFMEKLGEEKKIKGQPFWELRLGIHTGPIIAGVVGKKKFAYDIWGDTVNTASRMESSGEVGKVNISGTTYELIKEYFDCTFRGKIEAKNKGKIDMYFVNGIKSDYSKNGAGIEANEIFSEIISEL